MLNVAPKPTDQSRSHWTSWVPLQIPSAHFFVFDLPLKLRVVHIGKKNLYSEKELKRFFHKMLWIYSTFEPQQYGTIGYSWKILQTKKIFFNFLSVASPSLATKPTH